MDLPSTQKKCEDNENGRERKEEKKKGRRAKRKVQKRSIDAENEDSFRSFSPQKIFVVETFRLSLEVQNSSAFFSKENSILFSFMNRIFDSFFQTLPCDQTVGPILIIHQNEDEGESSNKFGGESRREKERREREKKRKREEKERSWIEKKSLRRWRPKVNCIESKGED